MTIDVVQQGRALCQALLLGAVLGMLYDLFRILRVRVKVPLLGPALDLLFWIVATLTLFLWSQEAWGGRIRLYGAVFCVVGGGVFFPQAQRERIRARQRITDKIFFIFIFLSSKSLSCLFYHSFPGKSLNNY